jgi:hypothetical protein
VKWDKRGLIWGPDGFAPWALHSALQPTPYLVDDATLRVYAGFRDAQGRSSVGYVDLDSRNPSRVLRVSEQPVLAPADAGAFAVDGVVPTAIISVGEVLRLYYAGYRRRQDVRFQVFCGLAVSDDGGNSFRASSDEPVLRASPEGVLFRVIHSIHFDGDRWRAWYGAGSEFRQGAKKTLPVYDIRYFESSDGVAFPDAGAVCIALSGEEHRVGRPWIVQSADAYEMYFGAGTEQVGYRLGFATSPDGVAWRRDDDALGLAPSAEGWDSEMMAYPAVISAQGHTYLFYNGNGYGKDGFGYAVRTDTPARR